MASDAQSISSGSDSGSTPEEERIRRLFQTCDGNGDGYIDSQDLMAICCQLNLEHCVEEIMEQLGADEQGRISYDEFLRRRMQLMNEINALTLEEQQAQGEHGDQTSPAPGSSSLGNWPSSSNTSQGAVSGKHENWEFDSGARDLSPEPNFRQRLLDAVGVPVQDSTQELIELANQLHQSGVAAAWERSRKERDRRWHVEKMRFTREQEAQAQRYEERITELHSVIAELSRRLHHNTASVIKEEDEFSQQSGDESRMSETPSHSTSTEQESCSEKGDVTELSRPPKGQKLDEASSGLGDNESIEDNRPGSDQTGGEDGNRHREGEAGLRLANQALREQLARQDTELSLARSALMASQDERERLQRKVKELQSRLSGFYSQSSQGSQTGGSSPSHVNPTTGERTPRGDEPAASALPIVAKVAERVRLRRVGSSLTSDCEDVNMLGESGLAGMSEFEVELERLQSRTEHLRSQNDLLSLALEETKGHCDRLSVLLAKSESNTTALHMALSYSDQALEAAEILLALLETEQGLILANCRAAGLGGHGSDSEEEVTTVLQRATANRRTAESLALHFLRQLDGSSTSGSSPWESLSSPHTTSSRTSSSSSSLESGGEFGKAEEQRLREHILRLKTERAAVRTTVLELESVHTDPPPMLDSDITTTTHALDLENAVLVQELMALKEEKAELKARAYLLEKEKTSLELQLGSREAQHHAYLVQIQHLKNEVSQMKKGNDVSQGTSEDAVERKEYQMKQRIQELIATLEKVTRQSEMRAKQSAEFVDDLKRANSALVSVFEKSKKKHQAKVKKLESQMTAMKDRHETQIRLLKQRIAMLEGEMLHPPGASSDSSV